MFALVLLALATTAFAQDPQWHITQEPATAKPNEKVVIEITDLKDDVPGLTIDWSAEKGRGAFDGKKDAKKVTFIPTNPGDVVILVCNVSGGINRTIRHEFKVAGEAAQAPSPSPPAPAPKPVPANLSHSRDSLPDGDVPIDKVVHTDAADPQVITAGFMADANTNLSVLSAGVDCKFDVGCFHLAYDLSKPRIEGWTGYGWQVVPQGEKSNWGEHKGKDLSGRGFRSLRVWTKVTPGSAERVKVEFKSGGNVNPNFATTNRATYLVSSGLISVESSWTEVCLDLSKADLRNVVSPFTIVVSGVYNPRAVIDLDIDGASYSTQPCPPKAR